MMVVTTTTTTATTATGVGSGETVLGGLVVFLLIAALIAKQVAAHSGNERLYPFHRALTVAVVPLALVVGMIVVQQISLIGS